MSIDGSDCMDGPRLRFRKPRRKPTFRRARKTPSYYCPPDWEPRAEQVKELAELCPDVDQAAALDEMKRHRQLRTYRQWSRIYGLWIRRKQAEFDETH